MIQLHEALIAARVDEETARIRKRSGRSRENRRDAGDSVRLAESHGARIFTLLARGAPSAARDMNLRIASSVRHRRGEILDGLREGLGGADFEAVLIESRVSLNGDVFYTREALERFAPKFEGAALVVRNGPAGFSHLSNDCRPWPVPGDLLRESGFFRCLRVGTIPLREGVGQVALLGHLHVYEDEPEVRALIEGRLAAGERVGLSIETPGPASADSTVRARESGLTEPVDAARLNLADHYEFARAERFPCVVLADFPAAGGRILRTTTAG